MRAERDINYEIAASLTRMEALYARVHMGNRRWQRLMGVAVGMVVASAAAVTVAAVWLLLH